MRAMTRAQMGQSWLKLPYGVMFFCTSGSMLNASGCGPQPTWEIQPVGRMLSSAILPANGPLTKVGCLRC